MERMKLELERVLSRVESIRRELDRIECFTVQLEARMRIFLEEVPGGAR
jgi:hypothetical protein